MGIAWIVGFAVYFYKRRRRKKLEAAGLLRPDELKQKEPPEKIIIPPDPAIIEGHRLPGESAFKDEDRKHDEGSSKRIMGKRHSSGNRQTTPPQPNGAKGDIVSAEMTVPPHHDI